MFISCDPPRVLPTFTMAARSRTASVGVNIALGIPGKISQSEGNKWLMDKLTPGNSMTCNPLSWVRCQSCVEQQAEPAEQAAGGPCSGPLRGVTRLMSMLRLSAVLSCQFEGSMQLLYGISTSGGRAKIFKRLKEHQINLQMQTVIHASGMQSRTT